MPLPKFQVIIHCFIFFDFKKQFLITFRECGIDKYGAIVIANIFENKDLREIKLDIRYNYISSEINSKICQELERVVKNKNNIKLILGKPLAQEQQDSIKIEQQNSEEQYESQEEDYESVDEDYVTVDENCEDYQSEDEFIQYEIKTEDFVTLKSYELYSRDDYDDNNSQNSNICINKIDEYNQLLYIEDQEKQNFLPTEQGTQISENYLLQLQQKSFEQQNNSQPIDDYINQIQMMLATQGNDVLDESNSFSEFQYYDNL
ncbi:hypothetical protein PPERSA_10185 [Pseudocohnilembus persalinus]|uniref:Uncharacterized protein n=1 Tax=Pseudocohnilembus persalinus TaxID=266149 RepID=A0A0V0QM93_PSEPJ|nr:hypothetical protein PPERSA_10185 [Pseudocohnilembus persalinus]|eukprot:KRX03104.1 hypothetical protein PPERSA_10185 [Pseudocohnilembus persalinus]